jgi:hypothetical protein
VVVISYNEMKDRGEALSQRIYISHLLLQRRRCPA